MSNTSSCRNSPKHHHHNPHHYHHHHKQHQQSQPTTIYPKVAILFWTCCLFIVIGQMAELVDSFQIPHFKFMSGSSKCCSKPYAMMSSYSSMSNSAMETFDDGTPLSFYREQVGKMHGGGGGGASGGYAMSHGSGGGGGGGMKYGKSMGGGGGGGGGKSGPMNQLYKNSFGMSNMLMGGGFMKPASPFGPHGKATSNKWRGYAKSLVQYASKKPKGSKLTNVRVVPSGAKDEYYDSYLTMITDTFKKY